MRFDEAFVINPKVSLNKGEIAPFVEMASIAPFTRDVTTNVQKPYGGGMKFMNGDILMARITPSLENGKTSIFRSEMDEDKPAFGSTEFIVIRGREGVSDTLFAYYLVTSTFVRNFAISSMNGSSGRQRVQQESLAALEIELPTLSRQKEIAEKLCVLDDKIASNERANNKIIRLAKALVASAVKDGASALPLAELAIFHNRRRKPLSAQEREKRLGVIPYYGATGIFGHVDEATFNEVLVLVGEDGTVVRKDGGPVLQYIWGPAWINNHAHPLEGQGISTELLYLLLDDSDIRPLVTGAVQPKVNMGNLKSLPLTVPKDLELLEEKIQLLFELLRVRNEESKRLALLRDQSLEQMLSSNSVIESSSK
ncbi:restriction endonuclease subunit S [Aurantimicrobium minutum]|uniref:restriction endonuclease subunit S n=1 Tax=Aurantimicrobium minutum TaxID=708131 RepID=UPI0024744732|nr:restriction endonuclease subunit S [Aurantimicrobium minutum]MDH6423126.1 type I restriction enzyme S subunit [Aurantimicrobium minutum]